MTAPTPAHPNYRPTVPTPTRGNNGRPVLRWLRCTLLTLLLALITVAVLLTYVIMTAHGTQSAWRVAVWAMPGRLSGDYAGGTLASGINLRHLRYRNATMQLDIDRIDSSWHLAPMQRTFSVAYLHLGKVNLIQQPTPVTAPVLPSSLRLPVALKLHEISMQQLVLQQQGGHHLAFGKLALHGTSDGVQHSLILDQLDTGFGNASARLHLNGQQPFAIHGDIALSGLYQQANRQEKFQLAAQLSGSLQTLGIALNASGDKLNGNASVVATPFDTVPLKQAHIDLQHINPQIFNSTAPQADLHLRADLRPSADASKQLRVTGLIDVTNAIAGSLDRQRLPLISLHTNVDLSIERQELSELRINLLNNAQLQGGGQFSPSNQNGHFQFQVDDLDLQALHRQLKPTRLHGPLAITMTPQHLNLALQLQDPLYAIKLDGTLMDGQITLKQARLSAARAHLDLSGSLALGAAGNYALTGELSNFDPSLWIQHNAVAANINMHFTASGVVSPQPQTTLNFAINNSSYNQLPMRGNGQLQLAGTRLLPSSAELLIAGNRLQLEGAFGTPSDRLALHLDAPQLARLGYGLDGQFQLDGQLSGSIQGANLRATYSGTHLAFGPHHLAKLSGQADLQSDLTAHFAAPKHQLLLTLDSTDYRGPDAILHQLKLTLNGTNAAHHLTVQADGKVHAQTLALRLDAHGTLKNDQHGYGWEGSIDKLDNQALPRLSLEAPLRLTLNADTLIVGAGRLHVDQMAIDLKSLRYQQGHLHSEGHAKALDIGRLLKLAQDINGLAPPVKTDLVIDADWNFSLAQSASGFIHLIRQRGDLSFNNGSAVNTPVRLGLSALQLRIDLAGQQALLTSNITADIGTLEAKGHIGFLQRDGMLRLGADAPLVLTAALNVPEINRLSKLLGPQYSLGGKLALQLKADGTLDKPHWSGAITGDNLALTLFDQGIQLKDGIARIAMNDQVIDLRQLEFHGSSGSLRASGKVQLGNTDPDLSASIVAERLQLFASPDRQLMLSGQARLASINEQLRIDGKFTVDQALFDLPPSSAPRLGDDVVIVRKNTQEGIHRNSLNAASEQTAGRLAPVIQIEVNLGDHFRFHGSGADLRLRGDMTVRSEPLQALRASGTVRVAEGTYEAFGTKLNIERGIINFQGPMNNPNLNILAMRRNQDVEAGVEVTGFVRQPQVRLVSEPNVPDDEKLAWMMFGHGSNSAGLIQRSASSQALALLGNFGGKKIAKGIGFDQFSIGASESGLSDAQVISLGKAITDRLVVGYEQSLTGAASIARASWQLSRRWSLVARTGTINGLNVLYNVRFD